MFPRGSGTGATTFARGATVFVPFAVSRVVLSRTSDPTLPAGAVAVMQGFSAFFQREEPKMNCFNPLKTLGTSVGPQFVALGLALSVGACGTAAPATTADTTSGDAAKAALELVGTWTSSFGVEVIDATQWNGNAIAAFDNDKNTAYTQAPKDDKYNPSKFSKMVWTEIKDSSFYYCTVDYGKDSLALAQASTLTTDATDPDKKGCGGFSWTKLTLKP